MFQPNYPIVTTRRLLRPFVETDLEALHTLYSREDVVRFFYTPPLTRAEAEESLRKRIQRTSFVAEGDGIGLMVEQRDTGRPLGDVVLIWNSEQHRQAEIGFVFHPDYHGQGFAREASETMLQVGFAQFGLHRIIGRCDARNTASAGLLERLGMQREAHFRQNEYVKGEWCDELVYAILAEEWEGCP